MKALIYGVAGQDGSYLAQLLLKKGYEVVGISRDEMIISFANFDRLGIRGNVFTTSMRSTPSAAS
jgi:GDPmannose 4,6-dehydratase